MRMCSRVHAELAGNCVASPVSFNDPSIYHCLSGRIWTSRRRVGRDRVLPSARICAGSPSPTPFYQIPPRPTARNVALCHRTCRSAPERARGVRLRDLFLFFFLTFPFRASTLANTPWDAIIPSIAYSRGSRFSLAGDLAPAVLVDFALSSGFLLPSSRRPLLSPFPLSQCPVLSLGAATSAAPYYDPVALSRPGHSPLSYHRPRRRAFSTSFSLFPQSPPS